MINIYRLIAFVGFLIFSTTIFSQETGTIRGKVFESETGLEMIGASVEIIDTDMGAFTDIDGSFSITDIPEGEYSIRITYVSFAEKVIEEIEVDEDEITYLGEITMDESDISIENVTITAKAIKNTQSALQTLQRKSINTIDGISSQSFSLRGDGDAAAAMKRVTGVSVEGGKYVYVRGLGDRYSKTTLNSANIPGLDPDKNTVQMDLFPTNLIDNIIVYKNFLPNLPGDFTGGLIDISTKDFPEKFTLSASISTGYNPQANLNDKFLSYKGGKTDWLGFDDGTRDLPSGFNNLPTRTEVITGQRTNQELQQKIFSLNNNLEPYQERQLLDHGVSFSVGNQFDVFGKSVGFISSLVYNRSFNAYHDGVTERYNQTEQGAETLNQLRKLDDNSSSDEVLLGGMISGSVKLNPSNKIGILMMHNQTSNKSTRYQIGNVVDASGNLYEERTLNFISRSLSSGQIRGNHSLRDGKIKIDWLSSYTLSRMDQPDLRFINNVGEVNNTDTLFYIDASEDRLPTRFFRKMNENNFDNQLNLEYSFDALSSQITLKAGGAYLMKNREFRDTLYEYSNGGNADNFRNYITEDNIYDSAENPNGVLIANGTEARNQYDSDVTITSGYFMGQFPVLPSLKAIAGVRVESTQLNFTSYKESENLNDTPLFDQTNLLPSVSLIYEIIPDKMNLRSNWSKTIARPSFREIAPVSIFDPVNNAIIIGNSDLKITEIDNFDLRWEYFFSPGEMISISGFFKNFTNPIELTIEQQADNQFRYENVDEALVFGGELEIRKKLDFITPFLKDFEIGTNVTLVKSKVDIPALELEAKRKLDSDFPSQRVMFGQSPYIVNGYLQYINQGTKASVSYNVQGQRLRLVSRGLTPDMYERPFHSLNFKIGQSLNENWNASIGVSNILNSVNRQSVFFQDQEYIWNLFRSGRTFKLGLSYNIK